MEQGDTEAPVVRQQHFECAGPVEIGVELGAGRLDVELITDQPIGDQRSAGEVTVHVRPDLTAGPLWSAGISGLLSWLGEQAGASRPGDLASEAVRGTLIDFTGQRLTVRAPRDVPLRTVPLIIQVSAPTGSSVTARSGSADIAVEGVADRLRVSTGSGQVRAQRCTGSGDVRTGSGDVALGAMLGTLRVRTGSGLVDVVSLERAEAGSTVQTGSGDVRLGAVECDLTVRTGSGDLIVADASAGRLDLTSGSGQLRVGIHSGVRAELDVSSGSGRAHSELPVGGPPAESSVGGLRVQGRTGSGDALITAAPS